MAAKHPAIDTSLSPKAPTLNSFLARLAKLLLRQGVTVHEFSRWADAAFVEAAAELLREQETDPSFSRISALTGLHRHAVSDILGGTAGQSRGPSEKEYQRHRLARVLSGWHEDPEFTDGKGRPRVLPMEGPAPSFSELARAYSGDIYPGIILEELLRVGAVKQREDGNVEVLSRRYTMGGTNEESMQHIDAVATDVFRTLEHNLRSEPAERIYEDSAVISTMPAEFIPRFSRLLERRAAAFLDDLDGWLEKQDDTDSPQDGPGESVRTGVRIVMFIEPNDDQGDK